MCTLEGPDTTWDFLVTPLDCVCLNVVRDGRKNDRTINILTLCVAIVMHCQRSQAPKQ